MSTAAVAENPATTATPPSSNGAKVMTNTVVNQAAALDALLQQSFKKKFGDTTSDEPWRRKFAYALIGWEIFIDEFPRLLQATRSIHASDATKILMDGLIKEELGWNEEAQHFVPAHSHSVLFRELTFALLHQTDPIERERHLAAMTIYSALKPLVEWAASEPVYGLAVIYTMYRSYETIKENLLKSANALHLTVAGKPEFVAPSGASDDIHTTMDSDEHRGLPIAGTDGHSLRAEDAMYFSAHKSVVMQMDDVLAMVGNEMATCSKCDEKTLVLVFEQLKYLLMLTFDLPMAKAARI
jgi:hypothetical protein